MNTFQRIGGLAVVLVVALFVTGCTRHKRGDDAFEHYFDINPPKGVTLLQAHWAGFYYPFGLDAEQMLLEFIAPEDVINELLGHGSSQEKRIAAPEEKERIFGWQTPDDEAVRRGLEAAPKWFTPPEPARFEIGYVAGQSAVVRFPETHSRYRMVIYDSGYGHIFVDMTANRVYISQVRGKLF